MKLTHTQSLVVMAMTFVASVFGTTTLILMLNDAEIHYSYIVYGFIILLANVISGAILWIVAPANAFSSK